MNASVEHSADLTARILKRLKARFYEGHEKLYFQELRMLKEAIAHPAAWLDQRGVKLPVERYESLLLTILRGIVEHGDMAKVRSPARYFLHAVQQHMKIQGETYYDQGKKFRGVLEDVMHGLRSRSASPVQDDDTVPTLAAAHALLKSPGGRRKKKPVADQQPSLF